MPLFALQFTNQAFLANFMARNQEKQALFLLVAASITALLGLWFFTQASLFNLICAILFAETIFTTGAIAQRMRSSDAN